MQVPVFTVKQEEVLMTTMGQGYDPRAKWGVWLCWIVFLNSSWEFSALKQTLWGLGTAVKCDNVCRSSCTAAGAAAAALIPLHSLSLAPNQMT